MKSQPKHPWFKKSCGQEFKKRLCLKRCEIKMGSQGLLLLMEFKFLIMMTRPQNITIATLAGNGNALRPGHHYQKFKFHQQQEALAAHFDFTSF